MNFFGIEISDAQFAAAIKDAVEGDDEEMIKKALGFDDLEKRLYELERRVDLLAGRAQG